MDKQQRNGFTLIELIVVITILVILGTIAFISFDGFTKDARNSVRITEIDTLNGALALRVEESGVAPMPDSPITLSVENKDFAVQGDAGTTVSGVLKVSGELKDPLDGKYYPYITGLSRKGAQVATFLEESDFDFKKPVFKGDNFGLILDENNNPIHKDTSVVSTGKFDTLASGTAEKEIKVLFGEKPLEMKAFMLGGQLAQTTTGKSYAPPRHCPDNFVPVPGNKALGQPGFCAGKYEASVPGSIKTVPFETVTGRPPVVFFEYDDASIKGCAGNGIGYHRMTLMERLTIARNIEKVPYNWSGGVVGTGYIKGGYNGDPTTGLPNEYNKKWFNSGPTGDTSKDEKRQLRLSNGEIIWDFIGNAWEVVDPLSYVDGTNGTAKSRTFKSYFGNDRISGTTGVYLGWNDINDESFKNIYGPQTSFTNASSNMGKVRIPPSSSDNYMFLTGGDSYAPSSSMENGLYSFSKLKHKVGGYDNVTVRCSYNP